MLVLELYQACFVQWQSRSISSLLLIGFRSISYKPQRHCHSPTVNMFEVSAKSVIYGAVSLDQIIYLMNMLKELCPEKLNSNIVLNSAQYARQS